MRSGEETQVVDITARVFLQFVAPLYQKEGITEFMKHSDRSALVDRTQENHFVKVAELDGDIIGIIEIRSKSHIARFFVAAEHQRKGVGRKLLNAAVEECVSSKPDISKITVNSSPNAVSAYRAFGFEAQDGERTVNGIRFVPMTLEVSKHT